MNSQQKRRPDNSIRAGFAAGMQKQGNGRRFLKYAQSQSYISLSCEIAAAS